MKRPSPMYVLQEFNRQFHQTVFQMRTSAELGRVSISGATQVGCITTGTGTTYLLMFGELITFESASTSTASRIWMISQTASIVRHFILLTCWTSPPTVHRTRPGPR